MYDMADGTSPFAQYDLTGILAHVVSGGGGVGVTAGIVGHTGAYVDVARGVLVAPFPWPTVPTSWAAKTPCAISYTRSALSN